MASSSLDKMHVDAQTWEEHGGTMTINIDGLEAAFSKACTLALEYGETSMDITQSYPICSGRFTYVCMYIYIYMYIISLTLCDCCTVRAWHLQAEQDSSVIVRLHSITFNEVCGN